MYIIYIAKHFAEAINYMVTYILNQEDKKNFIVCSSGCTSRSTTSATRARKRHGRVKTGNGQDDRILSPLLPARRPCCDVTSRAAPRPQYIRWWIVFGIVNILLCFGPCSQYGVINYIIFFGKQYFLLAA